MGRALGGMEGGEEEEGKEKVLKGVGGVRIGG